MNMGPGMPTLRMPTKPAGVAASRPAGFTFQVTCVLKNQIVPPAYGQAAAAAGGAGAPGGPGGPGGPGAPGGIGAPGAPGGAPESPVGGGGEGGGSGEGM